MEYDKRTALEKQWDKNKSSRKGNAENRIEEIENILLEMPFTDPQFQELVSERNNLLIQTK